jgi:hypothetical protein
VVRSVCYMKMFLVLLNLLFALTDWICVVDVPYVNAVFPYKLWWNGGAVFHHNNCRLSKFHTFYIFSKYIYC